MRKLKRTPILLAAIASLLTSCGSKSIAGQYGFQLGKANGTHFGIFINLKDEKYKTSDSLVIVTNPDVKALYVNDTFELTAILSKAADDFKFIVSDGDEDVLEVVQNSTTKVSATEYKCQVKGLAKGDGYIVAKSEAGEANAHCHIAVFNTDEERIDPDPYPESHIDPRAKKCRFSFSAKLSSEGESEFENILAELVEILGDDDGRLSFNGYYYEDGKPAKNGTVELKFGIDFSFIFDRIDDLPAIDDFPVIPSDAIEQIIYSTYNKQVITLNIPVSEIDALYQLYWYGHDINYDETEGISITELPEERCHAPGTHPTAEDIALINETYNYKAEHQQMFEEFNWDSIDYRDYYTLGMGLLKS